MDDSLLIAQQVDRIGDQFDRAWQSPEIPRLEDFLGKTTEPLRSTLLLELLAVELEYRTKRGDLPDFSEYLARFPNDVEVVKRCFAKGLSASVHNTVEEIARVPPPNAVPSPEEVAVSASTILEKPQVADRNSPSAPGIGSTRMTFGRYQVIEKLGEGAFGEVFKAMDSELNRLVAIKVQRLRSNKRLSSNESSNLWKTEARSLASLRNDGIVSVFDVGIAEDGRGYLVSEFVDGSDLEARMKRGRLSPQEAADLIADVATALHEAHLKGFVHRDIKPANILLDRAGRPRVADFGLALHEDEQQGREGEVAGTLRYMAPEQLRGEAHRLDGRADIWSLGVILYELLAARRPFVGHSFSQMKDEVLNREPKPPRMIDDSIPLVLERIVLKCLAKPINERYATAKDLAHDLRNWQVDASPQSRLSSRAIVFAAAALVVIGLLALRPWREPTAPMNPASTQNPPIPGSPVASELRITSFRVLHFRDQANRSQLLGTIGEGSAESREQDNVRVEAKFNAPAYCYLLAFNPNGTVQLCHPSDEQTPPGSLSELSFPRDSTEAFGLTDGSGQQMFGLVASATPLPAYSEWRAKHGAPPWTHTEPTAVVRIRDRADMSEVRGEVRKLSGVKVIDAVARYLREHAPAGTVELIGFPVQPNR